MESTKSKLENLLKQIEKHKKEGGNIYLRRQKKLKPKPVVPSPVDRIKKLPVGKLEKLQEFMDKLEKE